MKLLTCDRASDMGSTAGSILNNIILFVSNFHPILYWVYHIYFSLSETMLVLLVVKVSSEKWNKLVSLFHFSEYICQKPNNMGKKTVIS